MISFKDMLSMIFLGLAVIAGSTLVTAENAVKETREQSILVSGASSDDWRTSNFAKDQHRRTVGTTRQLRDDDSLRRDSDWL